MPDFDDPFKPSDATVMRPRPGAGRRGTPEAAPPSPMRPLAPPAARAEPLPEAAFQFIGIGLNPLVRAASPLLLLAGQLRGSLSSPDVSVLRRHALDEIRRFEQRARGSSISAEVVSAARYVLCACLDEAVLSTPWGAQSEWAQQSLLVALHRDARGGEKFFEMLKGISDDPERHIDLMELQYLCIALGFGGKYETLAQGHAQLADVQQGLYRKIRDYRGIPRTELSLKWKGVEDRRNPIIRYVPWWVIGAATLAMLAITFVVFYSRLDTASTPIYATLSQIGLDVPQPAPAVPRAGPTLKQVLAPQEQARAISVQEEGSVTRITLLGDTLFASGSAALDPAYERTLGQIAAALDRFPGHVTVVGHTDAQPIQSLRFRNNFDLSRERAASVARMLQKSMVDAGGIDVNGVGPSKPLVTPEATVADRARNRRVEVVHAPES
jgi:type VI secretion system protein ImpK